MVQNLQRQHSYSVANEHINNDWMYIILMLECLLYIIEYIFIYDIIEYTCDMIEYIYDMIEPS